MGKNVRCKGKEVAAFLPVGINSSGNLDRNLISGTSPSEPSNSGKGVFPSVTPAANRLLGLGDGSIKPRDEGGLSICRDKDPRSVVNSVSGVQPLQEGAISFQQGVARKVFDGYSSRGVPSGQSVPCSLLAHQSYLEPPKTGPVPSIAAKGSGTSLITAAIKKSTEFQQSVVHPQTSPVTQNVQNAALSEAAGTGLRLSYAAIVKDQREATPRHTSRPIRGNQNSARFRSFYDDDLEAMGQIIDVDGSKTISFSASELKELASPFEFTLIGKFLHGYPSMRVLKLQMANFNLIGECQISLLDPNHVLFRLSCEEDYTRLWSRQVLYITGFPMKMLKWTPNFSPDLEPAFAPVWVLLPYLPVHLFDRRSLFTICSAIGKPLRIDSSTANLTRASSPRICIEIDLSKKLVEKVPLQLDDVELLQEVEYESLPLYCNLCNQFGHDPAACLKFNKKVEDSAPGTVESRSISSTRLGQDDDKVKNLQQPHSVVLARSSQPVVVARSVVQPAIPSEKLDSIMDPGEDTIVIGHDEKVVWIEESISSPPIPLNTRDLREDLSKSRDKFPLIPTATITWAATDGEFSDGRGSATEDWYSDNDKSKLDFPPFPRHMAKFRRKMAKDIYLKDQGRPRVIIPSHTVFDSVKKFYKIRCRMERREGKNNKIKN